MKKLVLSAVFLSIILNYFPDLFSVEIDEKLLLNDVIENIQNYKNKTMTLKLRFKDIDNNFNKIVFYDRKNTDIIFDIAELKITSQFSKQKLDLHEGLEYYVTFTVLGLTGRNNLIGNLKSFQPVILSKLQF